MLSDFWEENAPKRCDICKSREFFRKGHALATKCKLSTLVVASLHLLVLPWQCHKSTPESVLPSPLQIPAGNSQVPSEAVLFLSKHRWKLAYAEWSAQVWAAECGVVPLWLFTFSHMWLTWNQFNNPMNLRSKTILLPFTQDDTR